MLTMMLRSILKPAAQNRRQIKRERTTFGKDVLGKLKAVSVAAQRETSAKGPFKQRWGSQQQQQPALFSITTLISTLGDHPRAPPEPRCLFKAGSFQRSSLTRPSALIPTLAPALLQHIRSFFSWSAFRFVTVLQWADVGGNDHD